VIEPPEAAARVVGDEGTTALLFGREDFGLSNEDIGRCESLIRIATPEHASLNLAQAVVIVAHHLYEEQRRHGVAATGRTLGGSRSSKSTFEARPRSSRDRPADLPELEPAVEQLLGMLDRVGYLRGTSPDKVQVTARQALQQAGLSVRHVEALRGMVARVEWALDHPGVDWKKTRKEH